MLATAPIVKSTFKAEINEKGQYQPKLFFIRSKSILRIPYGLDT
jgi:hypothetical protein